MRLYWPFLVIEATLVVLLTINWFVVLRRRQSYEDWRGRTARLALMLPTVALMLEIGLSLAFLSPSLGNLAELNDAAAHGGWQAFAVWGWGITISTAGLLCCGGLFCAAI